MSTMYTLNKHLLYLHVYIGHPQNINKVPNLINRAVFKIVMSKNNFFSETNKNKHKHLKKNIDIKSFGKQVHLPKL